MKVGIYAITNTIDGKKYVGKSINLEKRKKNHFWMLESDKHVNKHLQRAFTKYGKNCFAFEIIELCDKNELDIREIYYIKELNAMSNGYNKTAGGEGALGRTCTLDMKMKISKSNSGKKATDEVKEKMSKASKLVWKENPNLQKCLKNLTSAGWNKGMKMKLSEDQRKKISEANKGKIISGEHKKILHDLYKGEKAVGSKLKERQVIEIRLRFLRGERQYKIMVDYPVTRATISDIVNNRRWKHLPNTIEELEKMES